MMEYAVMTFVFEPWCAERPAGHERMIEELAALGAQAVEPFHTSFVQDRGLLARYSRALGDNGMRVSAVDVICDLVFSSPEERRKGCATLREGLEICAALGAEVAHVAGHTPKGGVSLTDARKMVADGLAGEGNFARQHGLTLAIEDYGLTPTLLCRAEDCLETLRYCDGSVRFVFDVGNFEFAGERADTALDALYPHTCYVHFKDLRPSDSRKPGNPDSCRLLVGCPLGEGIVPAAAIARMLRAKGYSGWVALEPGLLPDDPISTVRRDLAVLKGWFGSDAGWIPRPKPTA